MTTSLGSITILRIIDVILFGISVGGMVTGVYLILMSFGDVVPPTGSLYVALLGLALIVVSGQKVYAMFKNLGRKLRYQRRRLKRIHRQVFRRLSSTPGP